MPTELQQEQLQDITTQPLLNYLVALSYERKTLDFSIESNLNRVYSDLLEAIYQRKWEQYQHPALGNIRQDQLIRILEEIAIAAWHGNGRTIPITEIKKRCERSGLSKLLKIFEEGAKEGLTNLLVAFYFRQKGQREQDGERTFEFTHKSFSEYLIARRLVRMVDTMHQMLARQETELEIAWDESRALERWIDLCGMTALDSDVCSVSHKMATNFMSVNELHVASWYAYA